MKIVYIDVGFHSGQEIDIVQSIFSPTDHILDIIGIDANPDMYKECSRKYKKTPNVTLYNYAISNKKAQIKLYCAKSTESYSIYSDKKNVNSNYQLVNSIKFSEFISRIDLSKYDVSILKINIEGAEYSMIQDMDKNNLFVFDIYLGSGKSPYSILQDMSKVKSLQDKIQNAQSILDKNNVISHRFCGKRKNISIDLLNECEHILCLKR